MQQQGGFGKTSKAAPNHALRNIHFHVVELKFTYKTNIEISDGRIE
jgi:hypothetical protein